LSGTPSRRESPFEYVFLTLSPQHSLICALYEQLEDPGVLALIGFTAGARSVPRFGLARNFLCKPEDTSKIDLRNAAVAAYFWQHLQQAHPPEIAADIAAFYRTYNLPLLDPMWPYSAQSSGQLSFPSPSGPLVFHDVAFAPSCLAMSSCYSR
jgi:hypothetical protein